MNYKLSKEINYWDIMRDARKREQARCRRTAELKAVEKAICEEHNEHLAIEDAKMRKFTYL